jgi:AraC-like DNA-binding protein
MHINYYQLDIGQDALSHVPDGNLLLSRLVDLTANKGSFLRPTPQKREVILRLCEEIEAAIRGEALYLAFAKVVEFLCVLYPLYLNPTVASGIAFSLRTTQVMRYIEKHYGESITVKGLAQALGVSASFLSRVFKKESGFTVHEYLNQYRILRATEWLKTHSVTETAYACGFCDNSHFIALFKKHMYQTPLQYKKTLAADGEGRFDEPKQKSASPKR